MYLYLGQDSVVLTDDVVGIFDLDNTTVSKITRETLRKTEQKKETVAVGYDLPKSYVVCAGADKKNTVYLCSVTPATLAKRCREKRQSFQSDE
jgi:hypothetical protein